MCNSSIEAGTLEVNFDGDCFKKALKPIMDTSLNDSSEILESWWLKALPGLTCISSLSHLDVAKIAEQCLETPSVTVAASNSDGGERLLSRPGLARIMSCCLHTAVPPPGFASREHGWKA